MIMEPKERMKCANTWFIGGNKLSLEQKERLICIWDDDDRLEQNTNNISWYFSFPPRAWALEIAQPNYPFKIDYNDWFLKNNRKEFMEWFERLQNRLNDYRNTIPHEWKRINGFCNIDDSFNAELNSEEIEKWYNIFINSSEYRFVKGVHKFMLEYSD
jgi:hypothetical protein